jgi:hypothetical protein
MDIGQRKYQDAQASYDNAKDSLGKMGLVDIVKLWRQAYAKAADSEEYLSLDPTQPSSIKSSRL